VTNTEVVQLPAETARGQPRLKTLGYRGYTASAVMDTCIHRYERGAGYGVQHLKTSALRAKEP